MFCQVGSQPPTIPSSSSTIQKLTPLDFDEDDDFGLPSFPSRTAFGQGTGSPDSDHSHRNDSISSDYSGHRPFGGSLPRSTLPKTNLAHSTSSSHADASLEPPRFGKLSNGSSSSLGVQAPLPGAQLLQSRKGSFASLKNMLKPANQGPVPAVPPVPTLESKPGGYPTLRNPFGTNPNDSGPYPQHGNRPRANTKASMTSASPSFVVHHGSKQSVASAITTLHSSQRSYGGRSTASQSSSNFRAEDHPLPALPMIPNRSTPSRSGRPGSDTSMFAGFARIEDQETFGRTPAEEALKVVYHSFRSSADGKIKKILAKPLVSAEGSSRLTQELSDFAIIFLGRRG